MNEERKSNAIELTDEEMDKVSGGQKMYIVDHFSKDGEINYERCENENGQFRSYRGCTGVGCRGYTRFFADPSRAATCTNCAYYTASTTTLEILKNMKKMGYGVYDINGKKL